jgi:acetyl-CoA C-acetyltransferase
VLIASPRGAARLGRATADLARIAGWGHRTGVLELAPKLSGDRSTVMFPHVAAAIADARERAHIGSVDQLSAIELHDCFTITEYVLYEHLGLCEPGGAGSVIDARTTAAGGAVPVNPSGGLIGGGHPVGATGVRMLLDAARQVTGTAGDYQVDGAQAVQTVNIGGSAATAVSFVVDRDQTI